MLLEYKMQKFFLNYLGYTTNIENFNPLLFLSMYPATSISSGGMNCIDYCFCTSIKYKLCFKYFSSSFGVLIGFGRIDYLSFDESVRIFFNGFEFDEDAKFLYDARELND